MKYQFVILASDLQIVTDAHKEVGGYFEVIPDQEGKICMITFDNMDLLDTEGLKVLEHSCVPVREPSEGLWCIKSEVIKALHEFYASNDIQKPSSKSDDIVRGEVIKVIKELYDCDNKDISTGSHTHRVGIEFIDHSDNIRERIVTVNGEELFRDKNHIEQYGILSDPLRNLELWLFDLELRHISR